MISTRVREEPVAATSVLSEAVWRKEAPVRVDVLAPEHELSVAAAIAAAAMMVVFIGGGDWVGLKLEELKLLHGTGLMDSVVE